MTDLKRHAGRVALLLFCVVAGFASAGTNEPLATLDEVLAAKQDLWGLAAMRQPNGPSYEFFEKLLPPLRYVNAEFRHYPIVLSAPNATVKARLTSNGSGLNARANLKTWKEVGVPVTFFVGEDESVFGEDRHQLGGPFYETGLPRVRLRYQHDENAYREDSFAAVEPALAEHGVVFFQFYLANAKPGAGKVAVRLDNSGPWFVSHGVVRNTNDQSVVWFDNSWEWDASKSQLVARFKHQMPTLAIATRPALRGSCTSLEKAAGGRALTQLNNKQRTLLHETWQALLNRGAQLEVPETVVNRAQWALIENNFILLKNDRANYSAGNQYERLYQAECGDTARAFLLWGYERETLPMLSHQFDYTRDGLEFHNAGFKLQQFAHYYWLTRDTNGVAALRAKWEKEIQLIIGGREKESGLFPKERYCGDIAEHVYSLNPNANCWRGLRDFAAVLDDLGEQREAQRLTGIANEFRTAILKAVEQSEDRGTQPPFIPIMFFGKEKPYEHLTSTMVGSYWNLLAPYVIGSGVFGAPGCERERWMVDYFQEHGGICMGMVRFHQHSGLFACEDGLDDLYSLRYSIKLLQLDEVERALVSFYGKLAQGLTRETFIGAEGTGLRALDESGRPMYLPPNSTAQAYFLWMLRYMLVQDWDMDDDGKPETLRLCFATPKRWLEDGKEIKLERAPTAFGPVSLLVQSKLSRGEVTVKVDLPTRNLPKQTLLRIRVPDGWRVNSAKAGRAEVKVDARGTADISSLRGKVIVRFNVGKAH